MSGHEQLSTVSRKIGKDQVSGPEDRERRGFDGLRDGVAAGYSKQAGATAPEHPAAQDRLTIREAFDLRYHVPRSQVWEGSRGFQRGNVHLRVKRGEAFQAGRIRRVEGQTLCGKVAWYDRVPDSTEAATEAQFCARCIEIGTRHDGRLTALVKA